MKIKQVDVGLVPKNIDNILSHRVYPVPERIINFVWDFGQLSAEEERLYIRRIIKNSQLFEKKDEKIEQDFSDTIYECHNFVREVEERSGVSLRDVRRVIKIFKWFREKLIYIRDNIMTTASEKNLVKDKLLQIKPLIKASMICYGLRLNGRKE